MNFIVKNLLVLLSFLFFHSSSNLIDGEIIETKVSFSFFNAGKASMLVDNKIHFVNDLPCYKIDVYGRTTGFFDFFARVRDNWGVYIDTISYTPQKFYKYLQEGKYKKNEILRFNTHPLDSVEVIILDKETKEEKDRIYYHSKNQFKDIMRGYFMNYWISSVFYLRSLDYSQISIDTLIEIPFLSDKGKYNYKMKYLGSKKIKSLNKKSLSALTFSPVVPENKLFSGESPVTFWLSDDDRKIPLRLSASMRFGEFDIETVDFDNMIDDKSKEIIYNKYK